MSLPPRVATQVQRILDGEARRLLAEQVDAETLRTAPAAGNLGTLNDRGDQSTLGVKGQSGPVSAADGERGPLAA